MATRQWLALAVCALGLWTACGKSTKPVLLPESERGYFGQLGSFALRVETEEGTPIDAYQTASETVSPEHYGKFNPESYTNQKQHSTVFVKIPTDSGSTVLALSCTASSTVYGAPSSNGEGGTQLSWERLRPDTNLVRMPFERYLKKFTQFYWYTYGSQLYYNSYECTKGRCPTQVTGRLHPWTMSAGNVVSALIGPDDTTAVDTSGWPRVQVRSMAYVKDSGFAGAVVRLTYRDSTRKTLKLNRILPKP